MSVERPGIVVVCGATGRQGGAVVRHLRAQDWPVRALTRKPHGAGAQKLRDAGADVIGVDMAERSMLDGAFAGAYGVFNVQNPQISGHDGEIAQGRNVADAAKAAGVQHLVYGSAGMGRPTGVPSWDSKVVIADHMRQIGLPITITRPMAFMELMTDKDFYPQVSVWHVMPRLMGWDRRLPWLAADDVGAIASMAFDDPGRFVGADLALAGDLKTLDECREMWTALAGARVGSRCRRGCSSGSPARTCRRCGAGSGTATCRSTRRRPGPFIRAHERCESGSTNGPVRVTDPSTVARPPGREALTRRPPARRPAWGHRVVFMGLHAQERRAQKPASRAANLFG